MGTLKIGKQSDEDMGIGVSEVDRPEYPYGTELDFRDGQLDQLGISDMSVDDVVEIRALAKVSRKNEHSSATVGGTEKSRSMSLQLTEITVGEKTENAGVTGILYGD